MFEFKKMNLKEFVEDGFLQEANRLFFHPLGLSLVISIDDIEYKKEENYRLSAIQDCRDDPEGIMFDFKSRNNDQIIKAQEK